MHSFIECGSLLSGIPCPTLSLSPTSVWTSSLLSSPSLLLTSIMFSSTVAPQYGACPGIYLQDFLESRSGHRPFALSEDKHPQSAPPPPLLAGWGFLQPRSYCCFHRFPHGCAEHAGLDGVDLSFQQLVFRWWRHLVTSFYYKCCQWIFFDHKTAAFI